MERIAHNGNLSRSRFVELHGEGLAVETERFIDDPWEEKELARLDAKRERFSDSLAKNIP